MRIIRLLHICFLLLFFPLIAIANSTGVRSVANGIEMRNDYASMVISNNAELISCVSNSSNTDIAAHDHKKIAYATLTGGRSITADRILLEGKTLAIFMAGYKVEVEITALNDYYTFEVLSVPSSIESLTFLDFRMDYDYSNPNAFVAAGVALSIQTNTTYYPTGENRRVIGSCFSRTGIKGAKLAFIVCPKGDLRRIIKGIYRSMPIGTIPIARSSGGPFALDNNANRYDCLIIGDADPSKIQEWISFYSKLGIKQIDFMKGATNFIQGDFSFPKTGSAEVFRTQITDPLYDAGIISTFHTYSYYISYKANDILSNPKWQQQLEFRGTYTLSKSISESESEIPVDGGGSPFSIDNSLQSFITPYILIDKEIIQYVVGKKGFVSCKRGQCGTKAEAHKRGADVRIIGGYYSHIAPQIGSELYYEIAHRTADAYNQGGFRGFYFDAIDGLGVHLKHAGLEEFLWYYFTSFINEVFKYCEREPEVVEYSNMIPAIWSARGRAIAMDTPNRGYRSFIDYHMTRNKAFIDRQYVTTLGWIDFYPVKKDQPYNYMAKYMFFDDVDYIGVKSIAFDQTMVYNGLRESHLESIPAMRRNLEEYLQYSRLRQENYFTERVKSVLKEGKYEYKLIQKGKVWGFKEAVYLKDKLRDVSQDQLRGENPFKKQKPFIRLENMYSSNSSSVVSLMRFNESVELNGQQCERSFATPLDISGHMAIRIKVKGNGNDSKDALCIRLRSSSSSGYADYVVRLNFEEWREIILPNLDNAENPDLKFKGMEGKTYELYRKNVDFTTIRTVQVFKAGECRDVKVRSIDAVPLVTNSLTNPTITVGRAKVTFLDSIQSGEYIEYTVGNSTAFVYDGIGNPREVEVSRKGRFRVPHGFFSATVGGTPEHKDVPTEVALTFGLYGSFIRN